MVALGRFRVIDPDVTDTKGGQLREACNTQRGWVIQQKINISTIEHFSLLVGPSALS